MRNIWKKEEIEEEGDKVEDKFSKFKFWFE